jgi:hypothetical protein
MKKIILFLPLLYLLSCKEQPKQPETTIAAATQAGWTKPAIYSLDAPTTYYDDLEDQDFSDYSKLIYEIFEQVYAGKLQAYNFMDGSPLSIEEVKKASNFTDTIYVENAETEVLEMKIVQNELDKNIISIKLKETWHFNKETLQLEKRVLGAAPRMAVVEPETGQIKGYTPIFWVFFDKQAEQNFVNQFKTNS